MKVDPVLLTTLLYSRSNSSRLRFGLVGAGAVILQADDASKRGLRVGGVSKSLGMIKIGRVVVEFPFLCGKADAPC